MALILDSKFIAIYVLKVIEFIIIMVSLFLTDKVFSNLYMQKVYADNGDPPSLLTLYGIFLAMNIGFMLFLVTMLFLLSFIFKRPSNDFIISAELIKTMLLDYASFMLILTVVALIIGTIVEKKKYFRYQTEGLRASRAYKEIILSLSGILLLIPYFSWF